MIVAEAAGINEGMEKIQSVRPDLIFIDIELAGESGLELTRKIRNDYGDIPIAILTNYDLPEFRQAAQESGASYFFSKSSSTMDDVISAIKSTAEEGGRS